MRAVEDRFRVADGTWLRALHWGSATRPTVVLLHGAGSNAHWWEHLVPALHDRFRLAALEFRGHGDSDFPDEIRPGAFAEDAEGLLAHLGTPDAILVGHSLGAHVALSHAARHGRTPALVLIDPSHGAPGRTRRATRLALRLRPRYRTRERAVERFHFLPRSASAAEPLRRAIAERSVRAEPDGRFGYKFDPRWMGVPAAPRVDPGAVSSPVLVVRGAESPLLPAEGARDLVGRMPHARLVEIPGAGHHVHIDRPDSVGEVLRDFLAPFGADGTGSAP